eukprot:4159-Pleurochrysis_carterae.AAC.3
MHVHQQYRHQAHPPRHHSHSDKAVRQAATPPRAPEIPAAMHRLRPSTASRSSDDTRTDNYVQVAMGGCRKAMHAL